ncbi:restriction endonuclease subunit S [Leptolyngbya sp. FACHB-711]|uniref:restriction endonuclease subunit S n=1 Tax=Leptolyngbya sp. FACHB-711 TaxID=2692813 RepID=UPI001689849B|nr:restriction endonuclease subunit S [Leptolyngbya sp. FACHB-711]MBD2028231.1 restriction endonuclease subunit S [Leptolyngbya sp. FACHB-711]
MRWQTVKFESVAGVQGGFAFKSEDVVSEGIALIRIGDINAQEVDIKNAVRLPYEFGEKYSKFLLQDNDLLIALTGATTGKTGVIRTQNTPCLLNQRVGKFHIKEKNLLDYGWVKYWTRTPTIRNRIWELAHGGAQPNIAPSQIEGLKIPLPPISEQRRIVELLEQADALRKKRAEANEMSDRILPTLFIKMFGDPATNSKGWKICKLSDLLRENPQNGLYLPKENYEEIGSKAGVEMVHMSDLFYDIVKRGNLKRVNISKSDLEKYTLSHQDLLIARRSLVYEGAAKSCRIAESTQDLVFESSIIRIKPDIDQIKTIYLHYYLSNPRTRNAHIAKYITGATIYGINQQGLNNIDVIVPPQNLQDVFVKTVQEFEALETFKVASKDKLNNLFNNLLHQAFSGKLTSEWRKAHMHELLQEMEHQAKVLGISHTVEYEQLGMLGA